MCTDKEGPLGDVTFEEQHTRKLDKARLERERVSVKEKITSLLPNCKQYRSTADKYAKEIQDREKVIHIYTCILTYIQMHIHIIKCIQICICTLMIELLGIK